MFTSSSFLKYTLMPDITSRFRGLMGGGFGYLPYLLALVFNNVRLLPSHHPYLNHRNMGRFGVRHVLAEAANNVKFSVRNIDQIILFFVVVVGIVLVLVQVLALGAFLYFTPALALPTDWDDFFTLTPLLASQDIAYIMLDLVFGVPDPMIISGGFFGSCIGNAIPCYNTDFGFVPIPDINLGATPASGLNATRFDAFSSNADAVFPFPYHKGIHAIFGVYSQGLLVVAVVIASYFIATILAETAQTGTPFGKRFNKTWAPIRIVVAFGLLMPLSGGFGGGGGPVGLNSAQYLVLYAAKYGSAFASNGWRLFNNTLTSSYLGSANSLVSVPSIPDISGLFQFMFVVKVCEYAYETAYVAPDVFGGGPLPPPLDIKAYVHRSETNAGGSARELVAADWAFNGINNVIDGGYVEPGTKTIIISFGVQDAAKYPKERGNVKPLCGQLRWTLTDPRRSPGPPPPTGAEPAPGMLQEFIFRLFIGDLWTVGGILSTLALPSESAANNRRAVEFARKFLGLPEDPSHPNAAALNQEYKKAVEEQARLLIEAYANAAAAAQALSPTYMGAWSGSLSAADPIYAKGWAAAGIWYNNIARMNGTMTRSIMNWPIPYRYPDIMERTWELKAKFDSSITAAERFNPGVSGLDDASGYLDESNGKLLGRVLYEAYKAYDAAETGTTQTKITGNPILDAISSLFGTNGLYEMRRNPQTHPLAQLVGIGSSLVEASVRSLGYAAIAVGVGTVAGDALGKFAGQLGTTAASLFITVSMMAFTVGFVLYYVLPFLPFIYFFFAVGGWVKGIFEALVGVPLWALAHIRIDAHGLSGHAALNGYFLIFEVFVRPILILFGLLAGISIFAAMVSVLHSIYPLLTANVAGYDIDAEMTVSGSTYSNITYMRGKIDQFFFTVIYAIMCYMIGMSSFKLIDQIPNNILRWMGQSVATFNDMREDSAAGLMSKASIGSQQAISRIGGGLQSIANPNPGK